MGMGLGLFSLQGYVSVVTGAARGLGRSIAEGLARFDSSLVLLDIDLAGMERLREKMEKDGIKVLSIECDVTVCAYLEKALEETLQAFGKVDVLVNCAGITKRGKAEEIRGIRIGEGSERVGQGTVCFSRRRTGGNGPCSKSSTVHSGSFSLCAGGCKLGASKKIG